MAKSSRTKKYRKIDTSEIEDKIRLNQINEKIKNTSSAEFYKIDALPLHISNKIKSNNIVKIRNKQNRIPVIFNNSKKYFKSNKFIKQIKKKDEEDMFDLWPKVEDSTKIVDVHTIEDQKTSSSAVVASVKLPFSGQSYNPEASDYTQVFNQLMNEEETFVKERRLYDAVMRPLSSELEKYYPVEEVSAMDFTTKQKALQALSSGILLTDASDLNNDGRTSDISEDEDDEPPLNKKQFTKKSKAVRNKQIRLRAEMKELLERKRMRRFNNSFNEIKKYMKEIKSNDLKNEESVNKKKNQNDGNIKIKKLGKNKFVESPADILLPNELSGSLRCLKVKGNAARERIESIYRRGLLDAPPDVTTAYYTKMKTRCKLKRRSRKFRSPLLQEMLKQR